jgi:hypothetical protein
MGQQRSPFLIETKLAISIRPLPRQGQHREHRERQRESGGKDGSGGSRASLAPVPDEPLPPLSGDLGSSARGRGALIVQSLQGPACGSCAFLLRTLPYFRCNSKT